MLADKIWHCSEAMSREAMFEQCDRRLYYNIQDAIDSPLYHKLRSDLIHYIVREVAGNCTDEQH